MAVIQDNLIANILAWVVFHLSIGFGVSRIPAHWFDPDSFLYRIRQWENGGKIYQRLVQVRAWKRRVPAGGALYPGTFSMQNLSGTSLPYLRRWIAESCRAEFCHWILILPGFLFFLWNSAWFACLMLAYAVLNNLPLIAMQRFNRPRFQRLLQRLEADGD
jgi:glycosyl-4,4'-diaponeurosporenoate acyltransferase